MSGEGLWKIMATFGCPDILVVMVQKFHDGMLARVQNIGVYSEPFNVANGAKQGCILGPTLFSMMLAAMLTDVFNNADAGSP